MKIGLLGWLTVWIDYYAFLLAWINLFLMWLCVLPCIICIGHHRIGDDIIFKRVIFLKNKFFQLKSWFLFSRKICVNKILFSPKNQ